MVPDVAFLVLVAAVVVVAAAAPAPAVRLGNLETGFAQGQAAMNITSQAGQSVSGATPQRKMPSIHLISPYFLHHLQEALEDRKLPKNRSKMPIDPLCPDFFSPLILTRFTSRRTFIWLC
uniref:Uncharacterized protein n=1 Tax=Noccaea caerulescens TaxID=107243 RepID=A0A1J3JSP6_NOCCA